MPFGPIVLRQQIVANPKTAGADNCQSVRKTLIFPRKSVGEYQIKTLSGLSCEELKRTRINQLQPPVVSEGFGSNLLNFLVAIPLTNVEALSIPERSQAVATPVPVPSSKNRPPGFEVARVRSSAPTSGSDAMPKFIRAVSCKMEATASGGWISDKSSMELSLPSASLLA
jgi:hypothetical protein